MSDFLTLAEVIAIHKMLIDRYGGAPGIRDMGALEAALYRPQTGYYEDVVQEASALWESISQNHPFIDGNKRVAFAVTDTFLRINGLKLAVSSEKTEAFIYGLFDENVFVYSSIEPWLRKNIKPA